MQNNIRLKEDKNIFSRIRLDEVLLVFGVLLILLSQLILYLDAPYIKSPESNVYEQLGFSTLKNVTTLYGGYVCLLVSAFLNMQNFINKSKKRFLIGSSLFIICVVSILHYMIVVFKSGFTASLYESTPPIIYLVVLFVFISSNKRLYNLFLKLNCFVTIYSLVMAVFFYYDFINKYPAAILGNSAYMKFYVQAFFSGLLTCYTLKPKIFSYIIIFLLIMLAFLNSARSYIIQAFLFFIIFDVVKSKRKILALIKSVVLVIIIGVLSFNIMRTYFPSSYEHFIDKLLTDTRSEQYVQLFSQIQFKDLLIGKGYYFTYIWDGEYYSYIDNVYVFALIRYGFIFVIPLVIIWLSAFFSGFHNKNKCYLSFLLLQWLLAYAGLAVYVTIELDYKMLVLFVIVGKLLIREDSSNERKNIICI